MYNLEHYNLCTKKDYFIEDECVWCADLSNGIKIFQDDDRKYVSPTSAWIRLKTFLTENKDIKIECFRFIFGTHIIKAADSCPVYFYSRGILKDLQGPKSVGFHVFGSSFDKKEIKTVSYSIPELEIIKEDVRKIDKCQDANLIFNN